MSRGNQRIESSQPSVTAFLRAVEIYLQYAHTKTLPSAVRARVDTLRALSPEDLFDSPVFERDPTDPRRRYAVRLGNSVYPHMKLVMERKPDGKGYLFRADAHDRHCCPVKGSREFNAFSELMKRNQTIVEEVENGWAEAGLETFKTFLKKDLEQRANSSINTATPTPPADRRSA